MGHSVRVRREEEKGTISWKIKFRNGTEKDFVSPITTKPWGKFIPKLAEGDKPNQGEINSQILYSEPEGLNTKKELPKFLIMLILFSVFIINHVQAEDKSAVYQNEINWLLDRFKYQEIRGGTTRGLDVELDTNTSEYFKSLQNSNLNNKARDRLAILSMVGEYRVGFEFLETFGSEINYKLDNPYQSWGTEMVIVIKDEPNFISLQHIMMMYFKDENGSTTGPYIQKHWRQDWTCLLYTSPSPRDRG